MSDAGEVIDNSAVSNVVLFGDDENFVKKALKFIDGNAEMCIISKKDDSVNYDFSGKRVIVVSENAGIQRLTGILHDKGVEEVEISVLADDRENPIEELLKIDNTKPRFDRLEIEIYEKCNLNCIGCLHYSALVKGDGIIDIKKFEEDYVQFKKLFWGIETIRLMGGEPLMAKNFTEFVAISRKYFPDSDVTIVTNGLLIPKITPEQFAVLRENKCRFIITNYPTTNEKIDVIKKALDDNEIKYNISGVVRYFYKSTVEVPHKSYDRSFKHCVLQVCHTLRYGQLSICGFNIFNYRINEAYDLDLPTGEYIDIYDTKLTGWEINERFKKPHNMCRYCHTAYIPIKWKPNAKLAGNKYDYLVKDSFYERKALAGIQTVGWPLIALGDKIYAKRHNKL